MIEENPKIIRYLGGVDGEGQFLYFESLAALILFREINPEKFSDPSLYEFFLGARTFPVVPQWQIDEIRSFLGAMETRTTTIPEEDPTCAMN